MHYKTSAKVLKMRIVFEKGAQVMKTRAECLEKYGSDYFIEKNRRGGTVQN